MERGTVDGRNEDAQYYPPCAYHFISLQASLVHINQPKILVPRRVIWVSLPMYKAVQI
jgi:hypothetical protein